MSFHYLSDPEINDIKERLWQGDTASRIAETHCIPTQIIYNIKQGNRGGHISWPDGSYGPMPLGQRSAVAKRRNFHGVNKNAQQEYNSALVGKEMADKHSWEENHSPESYTQLQEELQEPKNALEAIEVLNAVAKRYRDAGEAVPEAVKASNGLKIAWIQAPDSEKERELIKRASDILSELK